MTLSRKRNSRDGFISVGRVPWHCRECGKPAADGSSPVLYCREHVALCEFCKGRPVGNAARWLDGKPRPALPCPRCGVLTPYEQEAA